MSDHLANERTFLAYLRTALAFIGFGFVVARFALYVRVLSAAHVAAQPQTSTSTFLGAIMIVAGIGIAIFSAFRYAAVERALARGTTAQLTVRAATTIVAGLCVFAIVVAVIIFRT